MAKDYTNQHIVPKRYLVGLRQQNRQRQTRVR